MVACVHFDNLANTHNVSSRMKILFPSQEPSESFITERERERDKRGKEERDKEKETFSATSLASVVS